MRKQQVQSLGAIMADFLRENNMEKPLLEKRIVTVWPEVMGELIARYTRKVEFKNGVLYVHLSSAALRQELFLARFEIVKKMNEHINSDIVQDIRLL